MKQSKSKIKGIIEAKKYKEMEKKHDSRMKDDHIYKFQHNFLNKKKQSPDEFINKWDSYSEDDKLAYVSMLHGRVESLRKLRRGIWNNQNQKSRES